MRMKSTQFILITLVAMALMLSGPAVLAKKGGHDGTPPGFDKGEKKGWGESETPPGWTHGKKKGWEGQDMPPGLFKKTGEVTTESTAKKGQGKGKGKAKGKGKGKKG